MKFIISYKEIFIGLQKVQSIIERKEIKPILSNLLIKTKNDKIEINATNLEVSIKEIIPAKVVEEGNMVIDARKAYEIIREMPDQEICFKKKENNWIEISTGDILFTVVGLEPKEFPEISFLEEEDLQEIKRDVVKELIEKTIYAASNDETRANLNGVFFEKTKINEKEVLRAVATDGHRLSLIEKDIKNINSRGLLEMTSLEEGIILSKKGVSELNKLVEEENVSGNIYFLFKKNSGFFKKQNTSLLIRLIDEEFPNYIQAIPEDNEKEITTNRLELLNSLRRISVMAEEKSKAINLNVSENQLEIYTTNPIMGEGKEEIPIEYKGASIKLGFNAGYLIEILNAIDSDRIIIKIKDEDSPAIIIPSDSKEYICIIMPMEIKG